MQSNKYFVYLLETESGKYYCGYTNNLEKRFNKHLSGKGAKYTRADKPIRIAWSMEFSARSEAMKEEYRIKHLSHSDKSKLCRQNS